MLIIWQNVGLSVFVPSGNLLWGSTQRLPGYICTVNFGYREGSYLDGLIDQYRFYNSHYIRSVSSGWFIGTHSSTEIAAHSRVVMTDNGTGQMECANHVHLAGYKDYDLTIRRCIVRSIYAFSSGVYANARLWSTVGRDSYTIRLCWFGSASDMRTQYPGSLFYANRYTPDIIQIRSLVEVG